MDYAGIFATKGKSLKTAEKLCNMQIKTDCNDLRIAYTRILLTKELKQNMFKLILFNVSWKILANFELDNINTCQKVGKCFTVL